MLQRISRACGTLVAAFILALLAPFLAQADRAGAAVPRVILAEEFGHVL